MTTLSPMKGDAKSVVELFGLINGFEVSQAIHIAATLGIADLLRWGPRRVSDLAAATSTDPGALYRLLRALAAIGIFAEGDERLFSLTPLAACLRSDADYPLRGWAVLIGQSSFWQSWGHLDYSIRTGKNAFIDLHHQDVWDYRAQNPSIGQIFDQAMTDLSRGITEAIVGAFDFRAYGRIVDVGGGQGALLATLLPLHPRGRGILFDHASVVARADSVLSKAGISDRCTIIGGDFFKAVPAGGDLYLLKAIIHDWEDAEAGVILRNIHRAMPPDARILIIERLLAPANQGPEAKFSDLNMMVHPGGRERDRAEYTALLESSGFRLNRVIETGTRLSLIEAEPIHDQSSNN